MKTTRLKTRMSVSFVKVADKVVGLFHLLHQRQQERRYTKANDFVMVAAG